jgi:hypothetical protein
MSFEAHSTVQKVCACSWALRTLLAEHFNLLHSLLHTDSVIRTLYDTSGWTSAIITDMNRDVSHSDTCLQSIQLTRLQSLRITVQPTVPKSNCEWCASSVRKYLVWLKLNATSFQAEMWKLAKWTSFDFVLDCYVSRCTRNIIVCI